jgi:hypothetical protein
MSVVYATGAEQGGAAFTFFDDTRESQAHQALP